MMIGRMMMWAAAALLVLAISAPVAFGADVLTKSECEAQGGIYTNTNGVKNCDLGEEVSTPPGGGNVFTCEDEVAQQGAIGNQGTEETFTEDEATLNPQGKENNSAHCR